jgi:glutathione S-transferase
MKEHLFPSLVLASVVAFGSAFTALAGRHQSTRLARADTLFSTTVDDAFLAPPKRVVTTVPPSWEELEALLPKPSHDEPVLTLYRDTNGWCPFCERVWVSVMVKKLPYKETLVSLSSKPDWYKSLVPTALVPAVLLYGSTETNERRVIWESSDILKALDEDFPDTPRLMLDTPEFQAAVDMNQEVTSAGFKFAFGNMTVTDEVKAERQENFTVALNNLDAAMKDQGPFRLGAEFTGIDAMMIPNLERLRFQLPITKEFDVLKGRPNLERWFDAMDSFGPYSDHVAGDRYSWTAAASNFARIFGGGKDSPGVADVIKRADDAAYELSKSFANHPEGARSFAVEAATKLVSNHEAVVKDCTRQDPVSQQHIPRASDDEEEVADTVLRFVSSILLTSDDSVIQVAKTCPIVVVSNSSRGALVARTVASRLCAPRDMGAPAAAILRACLSIVADRLEEDSDK